MSEKLRAELREYYKSVLALATRVKSETLAKYAKEKLQHI